MFVLLWPVRLILFVLGLIFALMVIAACVLTGMAFLAERGWIWTMATHFRQQYLLIQLPALVLLSLFFFKRGKKARMGSLFRSLVFIGLAFFTGLNLMEVMPYYWPPVRMERSEPPQGRTVRLMHANLFGYVNQDWERLIKAIREVKPDMIDLVEYTGNWRSFLRHSGVLRQYPYRAGGPSHLALYSKIPLQDSRFIFSDPRNPATEYANLQVRFKLDGKPVTLLITHPASPFLPERLDRQRKSFAVWEKRYAGTRENLIIVGDLNTTPWSPEFKGLVSTTGLRDSQLGFGIQPSWPAFVSPMVLPPPLRKLRPMPDERIAFPSVLAIPIDHVLVSEHFKVYARSTGPFVGSDHLPVVVELGLTAK